MTMTLTSFTTLPSVNMESESSKSGCVKNKQVLSMFNNLQCQLMTVQSTMITFQMNQNVIQTYVENVNKKLSKMENKLNSIHSSLLSFTGTEHTTHFSVTGTEDVDETSTNNETEVVGSTNRKRKKKKKNKSEEMSPENTKSKILVYEKMSKYAKYDSSCNMLTTRSLLHSDEKAESTPIQTDSGFIIAEPDVDEVSKELSTAQEIKSKKKRKRHRKRKGFSEVIITNSPSPTPEPTVIKMNLPENQRPNNTKIKFESDSENEHVDDSVTHGSATRDSVSHDHSTRDRVTHDGVKHNGITHVGIPRDSVTHVGIPCDSVTHVAIPCDSVTHVAIPCDSVTHVACPGIKSVNVVSHREISEYPNTPVIGIKSHSYRSPPTFSGFSPESQKLQDGKTTVSDKASTNQIQAMNSTPSENQISRLISPMHGRMKRRKNKGLHVGEMLKHMRSEMKVNVNDGSMDVGSVEPVNEQDFSRQIDVHTPTPETREIINQPAGEEMAESAKIVTTVKEDECAEMVESFEVIPVKNYSTFPPLHGPPRTGDKIAYKVLELSDTYSPEVSAYKEAGVISYNNDTNLIELHLIGPVKVKQGKFELPDGLPEYAPDVVYKDVEYNMELNWMELIEPKLLI